MGWMVVFGAGASYDSVPLNRWQGRVDANFQPPLTTQLFEQRPAYAEAWKKYDTCAPLLNELWQVARNAENNPGAPGVEEHLGDLVARYGERRRLQQQLMAFRFYLKKVIEETTASWTMANGANTNYATLLEWLDRMRDPAERIVLVTFNYDTLLDEARSNVFDMSHGHTDDFITGEAALIRPHGSAEWAHLAARAPTSEEVLIAEAGAYNLKDEWIRPWGGGVDQYAEVPAIAIPTRGKLAFECPPEHLEALRGYLKDVTHILTIGWRAQEEAFLELCREALEERPVRGLVVAKDGGESAEIALRLQEALPLASSVEGSRVKGFSNLILSGSKTLETFATS